MELSPIDVYLLSNSSNCYIVVKTDVLRGVGKQASQDVMNLYSAHEKNPACNIFQLAGIGSTTKGLKDSKFRGDYRCWVSVRLCEEYGMFGVKRLISNIVALCQGKLKVEHGLNGYYSVQATLYVSVIVSIFTCILPYFSHVFYYRYPVYSAAMVPTM